MSLTSNSTSSIVYDAGNQSLAVVDKTTVTPGTQSGLPLIGQSSNIGKLMKIDRFGYLSPSNSTMLFMGLLEGSNINSFQWGTSTVTQTITQTSGIITLNNNSTLTAASLAVLYSLRYYPVLNHSPLVASFRAKITPNTNGIIELGLASGGSTILGTAPLTAGVVFRIDGTGLVTLVYANNAEQTATSNTLSASVYYTFIIIIDDNDVQFIVEDSNGIPIINTALTFPVTAINKSKITHYQSFARTRYSSLASTATKLDISSHQVFLLGSQFNKPWGEQHVGCGKNSAHDPVTNTVTMLSAPTASTQSTPVVGSSVYSGLGGEFWLNAIATTETPVGVFSYTVSTGYTLYITDIWMPAPVVTTALGATAHHHQWWVFIKSALTGAAPNVAGGFRYCLGTFTAAASATVGTIFNGNYIALTFKTPLSVPSGGNITVTIKTLSGAATGAYRGCINFNGYLE